MLAISIKARDVELTDWLENYVENKIGKMDRYLPVLTEARIELRYESIRDASSRYVAEVTCWGGKVTIRGEERGPDVTAAIDSVVDVLYRQIVRYKGKRFARTRQAVAEAQAREEARAEARLEAERLAMEMGEAPPLPEDLVSELAEEEPSPIVRVKRFTLQPMDEQEAIEQMELLGHTFFVFWNANNGRVNVVYRRLDGNYGLLDPELA
ncbi:MAG: ribosome-associated translation inhibitor RaiA [Anaerolineae bacterium]|nr:ribosome-associated translation inhibitor RaiA [Anaerolineae bacterium]